MSDLFTEAERLGIDTSAPDAIQQTQIALVKERGVEVLEDLSRAVEGSFYTICGAGGDLDEWIEGMTKMLIEAEIGAPKAWYKTTGAAVNAFAQPFRRTDWFPSDLQILLFPLDGLDVARLAIFRLRAEDRWFDDIIANMR